MCSLLRYSSRPRQPPSSTVFALSRFGFVPEAVGRCSPPPAGAALTGCFDCFRLFGLLGGFRLPARRLDNSLGGALGGGFGSLNRGQKASNLSRDTVDRGHPVDDFEHASVGVIAG